jgi:high-affinity nickel permease
MHQRSGAVSQRVRHLHFPPIERRRLSGLYAVVALLHGLGLGLGLVAYLFGLRHAFDD